MGDSPLRDVQCQACGRWHPRETACTKGDPPSLLHRVRVALETLPEGSHVSVVFRDAALAQLDAAAAQIEVLRNERDEQLKQWSAHVKTAASRLAEAEADRDAFDAARIALVAENEKLAAECADMGVESRGESERKAE